MDEDQQYERFDVDNDFEGGEWIGGEFFAAAGRRKKRQQVRRMYERCRVRLRGCRCGLGRGGGEGVLRG